MTVQRPPMAAGSSGALGGVGVLGAIGALGDGAQLQARSAAQIVESCFSKTATCDTTVTGLLVGKCNERQRVQMIPPLETRNSGDANDLWRGLSLAFVGGAAIWSMLVTHTPVASQIQTSLFEIHLSCYDALSRV